MKNWIRPRYLKKGDWVGVVAPSDKVEKKYIDKGREILESWGLNVVYGKYLFESESGFAAGTPNQRMYDLVNMWTDKRVKLIWAGAGGYSATQLWPMMDDPALKTILENPKWFIGFSDSCTLHNIIGSQRLMSLHGPNLSGLYQWTTESREQIRKILFGSIETFIYGAKTLNGGSVRGRLIVSNLDSLVASLGTKFDPLENAVDDLVVGIEELKQFKSAIQRQIDTIMNHKKSHLIKALLIGRFSDLITEKEYSRWSEGRMIEDIIMERVIAVNKDVSISSFPRFGHRVEGVSLKNKILSYKKNQEFVTMICGSFAKIDADKNILSVNLMD